MGSSEASPVQTKKIYASVQNYKKATLLPPLRRRQIYIYIYIYRYTYIFVLICINQAVYK